jgi:4-hydroxy-tetrahydrodipicolinate synthase
MKNTVFTGAATAIITPMTENGVNYAQFGRLIDWQIAEGIDAIVVAGTTGEGSTLTDAEHKEVIRYCVERVAGRVPVIAGTGSNDIAYSIELTKYACEVGADAMLLVTPYYNKATQQGLIQSFTAVADASTKPCILYNVPGRTGCNLLPATVAKLAKHPNIVGIKEASGNMAQTVEILHLCGDKIDVYSGEDAINVPIMAMGGAGAISVLSNLAPKEAVAMSDAALAGDFATAAAWQCKLLPLIKACFCEVNPIPAKAGVSALGFGQEHLRMPLTPMEPQNRAVLYEEMRKLGINV